MRAKKALGTYDMLYWIGRIFFAVLMLVTLYAIANIYESQALKTAETEAKVFKQYLIYSPDGLSHRDAYTGRTYPGIMDLENFDAEKLAKAASFGEVNNMMAANITLLNQAGQQIKQVYYNRYKYERWLPLVKEKAGPGTVHREASQLYVTYLDSDKITRGATLELDILVPRT